MSAEARVGVRAQELDLVGDAIRNAARDSIQCVKRVLELALLEMNASEPERGVVADGFVDCTLQNRGDRAPGAMVHAIVQLEVADRELRLAQVVVQRIECRLVDRAMLPELRVEPLERFEEVPLLRVVDRLAEIEIAGLRRVVGGRTRARDCSEAERQRGE